MEFESVIGLEVHAQLRTKSKIFTTSSAEYGHEPNHLTDPVTLGLPGALPVLNRTVVEYAIMLGLATNCEIRRFNRFARKHYFYPDLPKGYQISQYDEPICERGSVVINMKEASRTIGITRIHMEEDAGKNIHDSRTASSLVDLNRAGVPLLEIVSQPDLRTPAEAAAYMRTLRQILLYLDICDGNMDEGSLRCDANVSVRPVGQTTLGTRAEIKNINSFKFVERALEYEIARQIALVKSGQEVTLETRLFNSVDGATHPMRSKEMSADYRYFPDPDLPPVVVEESWIEEIRAKMPELPDQVKKKIISTYGLTPYDAEILATERANFDYFERVFAICSNAKLACNWVTTELFGMLNKNGQRLDQSPVTPEGLGTLINFIDDETISGKMAKQVFEEMFLSGKDPAQIIEDRGYKQITNRAEIEEIVKQVIIANPTQLATYLSGNEKLATYFIGQAMKQTGGAINPVLLREVVSQELDKHKNNK